MQNRGAGSLQRRREGSPVSQSCRTSKSVSLQLFPKSRESNLLVLAQTRVSLGEATTTSTCSLPSSASQSCHPIGFTLARQATRFSSPVGGTGTSSLRRGGQRALHHTLGLAPSTWMSQWAGQLSTYTTPPLLLLRQSH
ncbi:hypothetical protein V8C34DRAFT_268727 [Trichoderma compactum]